MQYVWLINIVKCYTDVNECNKHPCKNGATCYNNQGSFACVCKLGYKGPLCKKGFFNYFILSNQY